MTSKNSISKKISPKVNSTITKKTPFLDRPLQSILLFMQENRINIEVNKQSTQNLQPNLEPKITIFEHPFLKDKPSLYEQDPENYLYYNLN